MKSALPIALDQVCFDYGLAAASRQHLLDHLSWDIAIGRCEAVIGPSGCGKSTLVKLMLGLEVPLAGRVSLFGREPRASYRERKLGVVFQDVSLIPWLTVRSNIELPLRKSERGRAGGDVALELGELFGVASHMEAKPTSLSGGMKARVAIARALVHSPALLIMDEPFASLDDINVALISSYLRNWQTRSGAAMVLISHNLDAVGRLAHQVLCFPPTAGLPYDFVDLTAIAGEPSSRSPGGVATCRSLLLQKYI
jgi:NitT/TauT family transport system ATP-binding protein